MNLKQENWLLILIIFSFSICLNAQKQKVETTKNQSSTISYSATVEIDENSKTKLLFESDSSNLTENIFLTLNKKVTSENLNLTQIVVKPNSVLKYGEIVEVIKKIRKLSVKNIKVQLADDFYAIVSKPLDENVRPNPLFLIFNLDKSGKISINNEDQGKISDLSTLKNFLRQVFKERADNGVFRDGSNELETTVFIKVPTSTKIFEVLKIAQALRESGSSQIGLQIDETFRTMQVQQISQ